MNLAVVDTGVFVSGIFWRHEAHLCVKAWSLGFVTPVVTSEIFAEYERVLARVKASQAAEQNTDLWLAQIRETSLWVAPVRLDAPVCRDANDDKFISAALGDERCRTIIARDRDLTALEKPFGINICTPREWLGSLSRAQRRMLR